MASSGFVFWKQLKEIRLITQFLINPHEDYAAKVILRCLPRNTFLDFNRIYFHFIVFHIIISVDIWKINIQELSGTSPALGSLLWMVLVNTYVNMPLVHQCTQMPQGNSNNPWGCFSSNMKAVYKIIHKYHYYWSNISIPLCFSKI